MKKKEAKQTHSLGGQLFGEKIKIIFVMVIFKNFSLQFNRRGDFTKIDWKTGAHAGER